MASLASLFLVVLLWVLAASSSPAFPSPLAVSGAATRPSLQLRQVQIVHRHGARSPIVSYNETAICGTVYPCGHLNAPGQTMLRNVGAFLRERYTQDAAVVDPSAPFLTSDVYNLTVSYSRSTDVLRTLQSSVALLRGLFPDMAAHYPAVHNVGVEGDSILSTEAKAAIALMKEYGGKEEKAACRPVVDKYFPDFAMLLAIAREVHSEGYCAKFKKRHKCAKKLCSIGQSYQSTGTLSQYPALAANLDGLCEVSLRLSRVRYAYDATRETHVRQGSVGQELAQELVANANAFISRRKGVVAVPAATVDYRIIEYSAHDTTVAPLAATLGDSESPDGMLPPYATTYVFELLQEAADSEGGGAYHMRVLRGYPGVTPESQFLFSWRPFTLRCMDAQNRVYAADENGNTCPLADFARFVNSTAPRDTAGMCYVDPVIWERAGCVRKDDLAPPKSDAESGETESSFTSKLSESCRLYRQRCPAHACAPGYFLDAVTYRCRERVVEPPGPSARGEGLVDEAFFSVSVQVLCGVAFLAGSVIFSVGIDKVLGPCGGREDGDDDGGSPTERKRGGCREGGNECHSPDLPVHGAMSPRCGATLSAIRMRAGGQGATRLASPTSSDGKGPRSFEMAVIAVPREGDGSSEDGTSGGGCGKR